ncbi:MAG: tryptophanase [Armatimonadota bacterium]|nr:tryptophanase [Armatimonadota bacterium]MDR7450534.1 tryptophanase [Armatimonadota bacterium]MDR7466333.1 tryptophanase [Armatimonadota bacterium]MDR7493054.1 tryptophanase [Armatimonadota bacterium]MDR7498189.1 tryptophanase [Armatimonadota bacterium]
MTIPPAEPYRIKVVEPIRWTTREERARLLAEAGWNLFRLRAEDVSIDLLTDSGTGAMSDRQWAALMMGDEAYAGSRSFYRLRETVEDLFGFPHVLPTHQGRGAEHILCILLVRPGQHVIGNMHFDTTRAHIEHRGGIADDLAVEAIHDPTARLPFKGDLDIARAEALIGDVGREQVAFLHMTVTCNSGGGQPVSLANLRAVRNLADRHGLPFFLDACRIAENAFFIKEQEPGYAGRSVASIIREICDLADGCTFSGKKDALVNIGGFLALRHPALYEQAAPWGVLFEGFPTYGGLAGRDLEAMAQGLREVTDEHYLAWRIGQVRWLGGQMLERGIPIVEPIGGHAVFLDALRFLPHLPRRQYPGQALACALYEDGGVRGVEIGAVMAGRDPRTGEERFPRLELVRLAVPRRVYTQSHLAVVAATAAATFARRETVRGLRIVSEPPALRHFLARFEPLPA